MRTLPIVLISGLVLGGCSAGGGMQATPPAPVAQSAESTQYWSAAEGASASADPTAPTVAGGRFLLM